MKYKSKKLLMSAALIVSFSAANFAQKAEAVQIRFAKGKSSATLSQTLSNDQQMEYFFAAKAGQKISLAVTSKPSGKLFNFTIECEDFEFQKDYDSYSEYFFIAPQTGNYLVTVKKLPTKATNTAKFFLNISIK